MDIIYVIIGAAITIIALVLFVSSVISYRRYKNKKLPFVILAFLFFLIRCLMLSISLFYEPLTEFTSSYYPWVIDLIVLNLLYLAAIKR